MEHRKRVNSSVVPAIVKKARSDHLTPESKQQQQIELSVTLWKNLSLHAQQAAMVTAGRQQSSEAGMIVLLRMSQLFEKCLRCPQAVSSSESIFTPSCLAYLVSFMIGAGMDVQEQGSTTTITTNNPEVAAAALRTPGAKSWFRVARFTAPHFDPRAMNEKTLEYYAGLYLTPGKFAGWLLGGTSERRTRLFTAVFSMLPEELPVCVQSTSWVREGGTAATITAVRHAFHVTVTVKLKKHRINRKYKHCMGAGNEFWDAKLKVITNKKHGKMSGNAS